MKVSVVSLTYNHGAFIEECLESIVTQRTSFDFEVLINDDCSTDATIKIIEQFQEKYPNKITLLKQAENQYSQGKRNFIAKNLLPKARGDYIAICEGDDFWTDPQKLQTQVDFLDENKDHSVCFHPVKVVNQAKLDAADSYFPARELSGEYTLKMLLEKNFIQTNSVMYRKNAEYSDLSSADLAPSDWYLHIYHALKGKIGYINTSMSAYRVHPGGVWYESGSNSDTFWLKHGVHQLILYDNLLKLTKQRSDLQGPILANASNAYTFLEKSSKNNDSDALDDSIRALPTLAKGIISWKNKIIEEKDRDIDFLQNQVDSRDKEIKILQAEIGKHKEFTAHLQTDLDSNKETITNQNILIHSLTNPVPDEG